MGNAIGAMAYSTVPLPPHAFFVRKTTYRLTGPLRMLITLFLPSPCLLHPPQAALPHSAPASSTAVTDNACGVYTTKAFRLLKAPKSPTSTSAYTAGWQSLATVGSCGYVEMADKIMVKVSDPSIRPRFTNAKKFASTMAFVEAWLAIASSPGVATLVPSRKSAEKLSWRRGMFSESMSLCRFGLFPCLLLQGAIFQCPCTNYAPLCRGF